MNEQTFDVPLRMIANLVINIFMIYVSILSIQNSRACGNVNIGEQLQ